MMLRRAIAVIAVLAPMGSYAAWASDSLKITIPRRSELTPVQRLNREGVDAVKKHQYEKAEALFYKAYLYDPADPFTLNNLAYISELEGEADSARKFYALASEQGSNANIDRSNAKRMEGKPMRYAFESVQDIPMRVNRMNVDARGLLSEDRGFEAVAVDDATSSFDEALVIRTIRAAGISAFVTKGSDIDVLLAAIHGEDFRPAPVEARPLMRRTAAVAGN